MIPRYSPPDLAALFAEEARLGTLLEVEAAVSEVLGERGVVPKGVAAAMREKGVPDPKRVREIEARVQHDVIAFVTAVAERMGDLGRHVHYGLTSYDVVDTALGLTLARASDLLLGKLGGLRDALADLARRHRDTVCIGRTHGVHAEPTTFGAKMALFVAATDRARERLARARGAVAVGKVSGAVGTFAHLDPSVEAEVCRRLGLAPAPVSSQVVQRDRHAEFVSALAIAGASLEQFATEVRGLQKTEIREVEEPFAEGQKGSSAMPHKRNPVQSEKVCGLARLLRGYVQAALEDVALWHERDISHSSVERVILPDACCALGHMIETCARVFRGLRVYPENMKRNLERSGGLVFSEQVLLALVRAGLTREDAYARVQTAAMAALEGRGEFRALLEADPDVRERLGPKGLAECFDLARHLRHVPEILRRAGVS